MWYWRINKWNPYRNGVHYYYYDFRKDKKELIIRRCQYIQNYFPDEIMVNAGMAFPSMRFMKNERTKATIKKKQALLLQHAQILGEIPGQEYPCENCIFETCPISAEEIHEDNTICSSCQHYYDKRRSIAVFFAERK